MILYHPHTKTVDGGDMGMGQQGKLALQTAIFRFLLHRCFQGMGQPVPHFSCSRLRESDDQHPVDIRRMIPV